MPARRRAPAAAASLSLSFQVESQRWKRHVPLLRRNLKRSHELLRPALAEMSVALVGDVRMSELHEQFMGIAGPTDVLTFPLETDARGQATEGEVVICVTEAGRRALEHELLLYALHGMLHLCGYDDRTHRAYDEMHRTEDNILKRLGIGPVFAAAPVPASAPSAPHPPRRKPVRAAARRSR
jgi:probable rRNA maturation factor